MLKNTCVFAFLSSALGGSIAFEFAEPPRATSSQCCPRGFAPLGTPEGNIRVAGFAPLGTPEGNIRVAGFAPLGTQRRQHEGAGVRTTHLPQGEYSVPCYQSVPTLGRLWRVLGSMRLSNSETMCHHCEKKVATPSKITFKKSRMNPAAQTYARRP